MTANKPEQLSEREKRCVVEAKTYLEGLTEKYGMKWYRVYSPVEANANAVFLGELAAEKYRGCMRENTGVGTPARRPGAH